MGGGEGEREQWPRAAARGTGVAERRGEGGMKSVLCLETMPILGYILISILRLDAAPRTEKGCLYSSLIKVIGYFRSVSRRRNSR